MKYRISKLKDCFVIKKSIGKNIWVYVEKFKFLERAIQIMYDKKANLKSAEINFEVKDE